MKLYFVLMFYFMFGCIPNNPAIEPLNVNFEITSFDVVKKQLVIQQDIPDNFQILITQWFNQSVKTNGFDGDMKFIASDFKQDIIDISDGKRVDISLSFKVFLNKPSLSQTKIVEGDVSSFGELTGNFTLAEFDTIIKNTQTNLILRLSRDLKSKI